jgi:hypothetical protein
MPQIRVGSKIRCAGLTDLFLLKETFGGARRNRTDDLFNAIEALSQLSYDPTFFRRPLGKGFAVATDVVEERSYSRNDPGRQAVSAGKRREARTIMSDASRRSIMRRRA